MTVVYTILGGSFLVLWFMIYAKMSELSTGKNMLRISTPERDAFITGVWNRFVYHVTHVSRTSIMETSHKLIVSIENFFLGVIVKLSKKFTSLGDMVRGKDIPRNRGSVSFFWKNIDERRKEIKDL